MSFASVSGMDKLDDQLRTLPAALMAQLEAKSRELAQALAAKVQGEALSGQVLQSKTGALRNSIISDVFMDGNAVTAQVGSNGDVKYAAIQEYGGQTSPHEIFSDKARVLAFLVGGSQHFARQVQHPGSAIPAHDYLQASLQESQQEILDGYSDAFNQAWRDA